MHAQIRKTCGAAIAYAAWLIAYPASAEVESLTLDPSSVFGTDSSSGTADITAFAHDSTVFLMSSHPQVASVPASVEAGFRYRAVFSITTSAVNVSTNVTITATHGGVSRQAVLTIRPPILTSVSFQPNPIRGGGNASATITINRPAPSNWLCSIQGPYPPIYFTTGSIVSFNPGATSTTKTVNTVQLNDDVNALITVRPPQNQTPNVSAILYVVPTRVQAVTVEPSVVMPGEGALGCATLNGPANPGGAVVTLESTEPVVAGVPKNIFIASGDDDGCFVVQSHEVEDCSETQIRGATDDVFASAPLVISTTQRITDNAANDFWGPRHSTTVNGNILWTDGDDVFLFDGSTTQLVQARGKLDAVNIDAFGLGTGAADGELIGLWRRGTDFAWIWRSGHEPILVQSVNPFDPNSAMNPEHVSIVNGHVFVVLQAFFNANAVRHVFRVDPVSGQAENVSGSLAVPGASRVYGDGGQAVWVFVDSDNPKLQFFDGENVTDIDFGDLLETSPRLMRGQVVYEKFENGVRHVFHYDAQSPGAVPVRLSDPTDASHGNFGPSTDGNHVAWLHGNADGSNLVVLLNGGLQLSDDDSRPGNRQPGDEYPLQVNKGQVLWKDSQAGVRHFAQGETQSPCVPPAQSFTRPYLSDGFVAAYGPTMTDPAGDNEVYLKPVLDLGSPDFPFPPILLIVEPEDGSVVLEWDAILGDSLYNIYLAEKSGVTKLNYAELSGGGVVPNRPLNAARVCGLTNDTPYFFVVATRQGVDEGGISMEAASTPAANDGWSLGELVSRLPCLTGPSGFAVPETCRPVHVARLDDDCDADADLRDIAKRFHQVAP